MIYKTFNMRPLLKVILYVLTVALSTGSISAQAGYQTTAIKADRFFKYHEWASAQALYELMLAEKADADSVYVKAIVASSMLGQDDRAADLLTRAMTAGVSFSKLMAGVQDVSFALGKPEIYEAFLLRSQSDCPWLERAIDNELLDYYQFRDNGSRMAAYASKMLAGLPESTKYMSMLARAYTLSGRFGDAVELWQTILQQQPDDYDTLLNLGNYLNITGEKAKALEYLKRAQAIRATPYVAGTINEIQSQTK